jgi:hypothetical protein
MKKERTYRGDELLQLVVLVEQLLIPLLVLLGHAHVRVVLGLGLILRVPYHLDDLWHEYESHAEEAAEDYRQRNEDEARVLLAGDDHRHGRRDQAQHDDVVYRHANVARVVDLLHLDAACLVSQEESEHENDSLVAVYQALKIDVSTRSIL